MGNVVYELIGYNEEITKAGNIEYTPIYLAVNKKGYRYKVNFSTAVHLCRLYISGDISPPVIKELIKRETLPVRNDRKGQRRLSSKSAISFAYRLS